MTCVGDVAVHDASSLMREDDEHVQRAERGRGNHEEVDRRCTGQVVQARPLDLVLRVFALRPYQPSARRVYQPAGLP